MSAAMMNEIERLIGERDELAEKLVVATKRLEDGHMAPAGWISGDRYEAVSREKMDYRRRWKEVCEDRDALAVHVERLCEHIRNDDELLPVKWAIRAHKLMDSAPTTSLARIKARWQAEALEEQAEAYAQKQTLRISMELQDAADEKRRQAEKSTNGHN